MRFRSSNKFLGFVNEIREFNIFVVPVNKNGGS